MFIFSLVEPGRHYARASNPSHHVHGGGGRQQQQSRQPQGFDRRESLSRVAHTGSHHPNLPKSGASKYAKRSSKIDSNDAFMKTPDAGQSG